MKFKPTLIAVAVLTLAGSVQAQTSVSKTETQAIAQYGYMYKGVGTGITLAWERGYTGQGVKVAVIDSGFDLSQADLKGQVLLAKNFNTAVIANTKSNTNNFASNIQNKSNVMQGFTYDAKSLSWINNSNTLTDVTWSSHGTQMASIIAGKRDNNVANGGTIGIAYNAQLLVAQVGQGIAYSSGKWSSVDNGIGIPAINSALAWAEYNGASVANLSLGSSYNADKTFRNGVTALASAPGVYIAPTKYGSMFGFRAADLTAFANASKSMVLVAAAGNDGLPYAQFPGAFATQVKPNGELVLGGRMLIVGSVNSNNVISTFSNRAGSFCTNLGTVCNDPYYVKDFFVVAPGENVLAALPSQTATTSTTKTIMGTSPATAYVSGGIALLKQAWPQLSAAQLVSLVKNTATDLTYNPTTKKDDLIGVDEVYGYGLVNFDKASQPYANVKYTTAPLGSGQRASGVALTNTGMATTSGMSAIIKTSTVLSNVQVVDDINRNYTADFTKAVGNSSPVNSLAMSPYLAMQGTGYREFTVPFGKTDTISFMQSSNGIAAQFETAYTDTKVSLQVGSMTEANGFLNNYGSGLTAFGNSGTTWAMVGGEKDIGDNFALLGSYGVGLTKTGSVQNSMIALSPTLVSDTWKLGIAKNNIFFSGKTNDKLSLSVQGPVAVRKGYADVTAVTGYNYTTDAEDNTTATPITSTERVNLASGKRETNLILGYTVQVQNQTYVGFAVGRQFNANGVNGNTVAFTARSVF